MVKRKPSKLFSPFSRFTFFFFAVFMLQIQSHVHVSSPNMCVFFFSLVPSPRQGPQATGCWLCSRGAFPAPFCTALAGLLGVFQFGLCSQLACYIFYSCMYIFMNISLSGLQLDGRDYHKKYLYHVCLMIKAHVRLSCIDIMLACI